MKTPRTAASPRDCNDQPLLFQDLGSRQVVADFSGGYLSSDGGALLLRQLDRGLGLTRTLAQAFTDRLSTHHLGSNQLRLWLATLAYLLVERLRSVGLRGSELARATVGTMRARLLKVAASVTVSVRRVWVRLSSAFPLQALYRRCAWQLGCVAVGVT